MRATRAHALAGLATTWLLLAAATIAPSPARAASAQVAALQVALTAVGAHPGPIDGMTGPRTRAAVRRVQARHRLAVDGVAGPRTRAALGRRGRPRLGSRPLHSGMRGWDVAALQFLLHTRGYEPSGFDGGFGPNTDEAVRGFQGAAGLTEDGVAGPATLAALRNRSVSTSTPSSGSSSTPTGPVRFLRPVPGGIGDGFGYPGGRKHTGLDMPVWSGTPIRAAGVGVVGFAGWNDGGYGNLVVVRHRLGYETWYAHMSRIVASVGEGVNGGTLLGYVGATGHTTGPHLHFEVRHFGTPIDPVPYLLDAVAARAGSGSSGGAGSAGDRDERRLRCRINADARLAPDLDPATARIDHCI
jgi:peptidoglycan hydrolase-like protein with peptidoglycan-binding domain